MDEFRSKLFNPQGQEVGWIYGQYYNEWNGSFYYFMSVFDEMNNYTYQLNGEEYLCMKIGLVDKNGKILYQHDKIKYLDDHGCEYISLVDANMIGGLWIEDLQLSIHLGLEDITIRDGNFEIIGNKWDDKDHENRPLKNHVPDFEKMGELPF